MKRPFRQGDRVHTPNGWAEIVAEFNNDPKKVGWWRVVSESGGGVFLDFPASRLRHETFGEYMTRPGGFGKTGWGQFWALQAFVMCLMLAGIATWNDYGWTANLAGLVVEAVFVFGTYMNYTRRWV